jgi:hypothetical protein
MGRALNEAVGQVAGTSAKAPASRHMAAGVSTESLAPDPRLEPAALCPPPTQVMNTFLPSAVKFHYQFNLREMSNVVGGLCRMTKDVYREPVKVGGGRDGLAF